MHCSEFRERHCSFVDDTLPGIELVRMQRHMAECPGCAEHDAKIRRSLLVFRNLPSVELSPDFTARLDARLRECREHHVASDTVNFRAVLGFGAVASILMMGYVASSFNHPGASQAPAIAHYDMIALPPVVALAQRPAAATPVRARVAARTPARQPEIVSASSPLPAMAASVSAGMPIWPAAIFAEQAPLHFATYRQTH